MEIPQQTDLNDFTNRNIIHKDLCYVLYGYFYKIYNILGPGYRETTYEKAFIKELKTGGISSETDKEIPIVYDNSVIDTHKIKLIVDAKMIICIIAYSDFDSHWKARLKIELRASNLELGLIVNCGSYPLVIERVLNSGKR